MGLGLKPCRCCGSLVINEYDSYDICPVCGWEDDDYQYNNPDSDGGANKLSLNRAKVIFAKKNALIEYTG